MARTRTQQKAAAVGANAAAQQIPAAADRRSVRMKHTRNGNNSVHWNSKFAVQLNDADSVVADAENNINIRLRPYRPASSLKDQQRSSNVRTVADLPSSPPIPVSPGTVPVRRTRARQKIQAVSDFKATRPGRMLPASQKDTSASTSTNLPANFGPQQTFDSDAPAIPSGPQEARSSLLGSTSSPAAGTKRRRASSSAFFEPSGKRGHVPYDALNDLDVKLLHHPRALKPVEVGALFTEFKEQLRKFAFKNFKHTSENPEDWPLHELSDRYVPLMQTTLLIADGSQYGWRQFFTNPESRASLVYGIIGEYIRQHVFAVPAFGLPEADAKDMENIDFKYLHYDAFTRVKHRAGLLKNTLRSHNWKASRASAVENLVDQLLAVLTPLMPPDIFRYDEESRSYGIQNDGRATRRREELRSDLEKLIQKASALNWSLVLTGKDGSVVLFAPHVTKGEKYYGDRGAPQNCINYDMMDQTQAHGFPKSRDIRASHEVLYFPNGVADAHGDDDKPWRPRIKMTCFPRVEMYVPHGLDQETFEHIQAYCRKRGSDPSNLVPEVFPAVPDEVKLDYEKSNGKWPSEAGEMRMAYIDYYQQICPYDVYLEHNYVPETEEQFMHKYFLRNSEPVLPRNRSRRHPAGQDSDHPDSDISSVSSDSSATSSHRDRKPSRKYLPGDSDEKARQLYRQQERQLRRHLHNMDTKLESTHTLPLPPSQRISLEQAVAQARAEHASRSVTTRLRLAAHDNVRTIWNKLIAPHGTSIENYAFLLALTALVCWYKGYTSLPTWLTTGLRNARNLTMRDVKERLQQHTRLEGVSRFEDLWAKGSARLGELLPLQGQQQHTATATMVDGQGHSVTATRIEPTAGSVTRASAQRWAGAVLRGIRDTAFPRHYSLSARSTLTGSTISSGADAAANAAVEFSSLTSSLLTTVVATTTETTTGEVAVSTPPMGGIVPGSGKGGFGSDSASASSSAVNSGSSSGSGSDPGPSLKVVGQESEGVGNGKVKSKEATASSSSSKSTSTSRAKSATNTPSATAAAKDTIKAKTK